MDFRELGKYILILGIVILAVGLIMNSMNQPISVASAPATKTNDPFEQMRQGIANMGLRLEAIDENVRREFKRKDAKNIMIAGALVSFVGFAIFASAKKTASKPVENNKH